MRHCFGVLCLILAVTSVKAAGQSAKPALPLLIETQELAVLLGKSTDLRIIDARDAASYAAGHLPGAVNLPAAATDNMDANRQGLPVPAAWAERIIQGAGINTASHVVVYDEQGSLPAARVFYFLEFFGHPRVQLLNGGLAKWKAERRETTTNTPPSARGDFVPAPAFARSATAEWIVEHLKDPHVAFVDGRSPAEYQGEHLPGAINLPWTEVLGTGTIQTLPPLAQLRQLFARAGLKPAREVVVYCQTGKRAAALYLALRRAGYKRVRLYDGSWAEWSQNSNLPVAR